MPKATLIIKDEVNVRFRGLDAATLDDARKQLTFFVPGFIHMPKYKLGRWDGTIGLFKQSGTTSLHLVDEIVDIIESRGYEIDIEDHRKDFSHISNKISLIKDDYFGDIIYEGEPFRLRDYQVAGVNKALENGIGLLEMATGSGKTLVCATLGQVYSQFGRVVVIVPSIDLILQTQHKFKMLGIDPGIWFGDVKDRKDITIATWQSLDHFPELFEGVNCVIVDEVHQAKAKVLSEMLSGPAKDVPFRFGCTGTLPKEEIFQAQIRANLGKQVFKLQTWELQEKGVLANTAIYQLEFQDTSNPRYSMYQKTFEDWADEINFLMSDPKRLKWLGGFIQEMADDIGNVLVLVQYRKHGKALQEQIPGSISLDGRDKNRAQYYDQFDTTDGNVLICTFGIASVGLDIPRIFNLFFIEPGKKFEKVLQSLGRGVRRASDKDHLMVFDIVSDSGISKKHAKQRKKLYAEAKQPFEKTQVNYT